MSVKVFKTNKADKIEFTRAELEKLLNDVYEEGYRDGENHAKNNYWTWASPYISNITPYYDTNTNTSDSTSNSATSTISGTNVRPLNSTELAGNGFFADKITGSCGGTCDCDGACNATTNKIKIETRGEAKNGKADVTAKVSYNDSPAKTYEVKNLDYSPEDLGKMIGSIFNGNFSVLAPENIVKCINKTPITDDVFTKLAKELNF